MEDSVRRRIIGIKVLCPIISLEMIHLGKNSISGGMPANLDNNIIIPIVSLFFLLTSFLSFLCMYMNTKITFVT